MSQFHDCRTELLSRRHGIARAAFVGVIALGLVVWSPSSSLAPWSFSVTGVTVLAQEASVIPATVEVAANVLDLRTFPMMEGAGVSNMRTLGMLMYEAKGDAKTAFEFQRKQLMERGWKELPGAYIDAASTSAKYTKDNFIVAVSTSDSSSDPTRAGLSRVTLANLGNVRADKLPVPPGVKAFHADVMEGSYLTDAKIPESIEACSKLLLAAGWEPYGKASSDPNSPMLYFKRNAIQVMAWVSSAPAEGGKTLIRYSTELLSADLPVPPEAPDPDYTDFQKTLRFDWPGEDAEAVVAFYKKRLPTQGWKPTTERPVGDKQHQFQIFRNTQGEMVSLDLTKFVGIVRVEVKHQTAAEVAAENQRLKEEEERQRQELAKRNVKMNVAIPLPAKATNLERLSESAIEFTLATGSSAAAFDLFRKHFLKAGWTEEEGTQTERNFGRLNFKQGDASLRISYIDSGFTDAEITVSGSSRVVLEPTGVLGTSSSQVETPKVAASEPASPRFPNIPGVPDLNKLLNDVSAANEATYPSKSKKAGQREPKTPSIPNLAGEAEINKLLQDVQAAAKALDTPKQPAAKKRSTPTLPDKVARNDAPRSTTDGTTSNAPPSVRLNRPKITVADQQQSRGTLWLGNKTYKLEYGVAYETKSSGQTETEVLFSAKPIAVDKLVALLSQGESTGDAVGFEPHLKLQFDADGKFTYFFFHAQGANVGQGGDGLATAEITVKAGRARGKAVMEKPAEAFGDEYRFEASFDAALANGQPAASNAAPIEPVAGGLVAEEHDGLPFPVNTSTRSASSSRYRKSVTATVPAEIKSVADFYRRELAARGWKENADAAKVTPEQTQLVFTGPAGGITVRLARQGNEVSVNLVSKDAEKAKRVGILPQPNRARLVLGNASTQLAVIVINGREYKIAAGAGAKDPKDGTSLNVLPGRYNVTLKIPGKADQSEALNVSVDETWGVVVLPTGGYFAEQLY